jgi:hypothetical protein
VKAVRAGWTSASFLVYAGALTALLGAFAWQTVISAEHGKGAFAGWSVLFFAVALALAAGLFVGGRRLVAGLFAFVALGLFGVMVGAFFSWFGWLKNKESPFGGFHWGDLGLELLVLLAALVALRIFRFPLLVAVAAAVAWFFVTDLISSGGNWSATVTLLVGLALFPAGLRLGGGLRPYGFWVHVVAGLTVGGALLYFWHSGDGEWALIIVASLVFIAVGAAATRSSYAVLGAVGLALATGHYAASPYVPFFPVESAGESIVSASATAGGTNGSLGTEGSYSVHHYAPWQGPVAYLCLGLFLVLVGMLLFRRGDSADQA